jgi:hypothetical protein
MPRPLYVKSATVAVGPSLFETEKHCSVSKLVTSTIFAAVTLFDDQVTVGFSPGRVETLDAVVVRIEKLGVGPDDTTTPVRDLGLGGLGIGVRAEGDVLSYVVLVDVLGT